MRIGLVERYYRVILEDSDDFKAVGKAAGFIMSQVSEEEQEKLLQKMEDSAGQDVDRCRERI